MKVLVLGASGFVGLAVCQALVRAGHEVHGVTRSAENAQLLAQDEIAPVVADYDKPETYLSSIATLDVIIDAVGGSSVRELGSFLFATVRTYASTHRSASAPKLAYIYTSGAWNHGDNRKDVKTDTTPLTEPISFVAWRPEIEQQIQRDDILNGIVIRPSLVYGRSGSILALLFHKVAQIQAQGGKGKIEWPGTPGGRWAVVHIDDVASMYALVAEKSSVLGGKVFDCSNDLTESVDDVLTKLVAIADVKEGYEYVKPTNPLEEAITTTGLLRPYLGRALLGWRPVKPGFVDGLERYYAAWQANQGRESWLHAFKMV